MPGQGSTTVASSQAARAALGWQALWLARVLRSQHVGEEAPSGRLPGYCRLAQHTSKPLKPC